tara:strand:+ start:2485 stop:3594 length:1110 start_codon:yes stop_codon:yes gene_type:complete
MKQKYSFLRSIKPTIAEIDKYLPGESIINSKIKIAKLSSNESPFQISKSLKKKIFDQLLESNKYPDGTCHTLKKALSKKFNLKTSQIICGNGSDDILSLICLAFAREDTEVICCKESFSFYPIIGKSCGARINFATTDNLKVSFSNIQKKINNKTRIIFIANPNNPTGTVILKEELVRGLRNIPKNIIIVIDGAYAEYVEDKRFSNSLSLVKSFPNLIVTRTFSKIYGLAGLRVGWGYSSKKIIEILEKIRGPFNVNFVAQLAAEKMLNDEVFLKKSLNHNKKWKKLISNQLTKLGFFVSDSFANFLLVKSNFKKLPSSKIVKELKKKNVFIRDLQNYGLEDYFRVSIGSGTELKYFMQKLKIIIKKYS